MSWNHDSEDYSTWGEWDDEGNIYYRAMPADSYPLEYHSFRQLVNAALGYIDTQWEVPLYDATHYEFIALVASFAATGYERELKFYKFLQLPAELRINVYKHYIVAENSLEKSTRLRHGYGPETYCCVWNWPQQLRVCDQGSRTPLATSRFAPWLPNLAFTNTQTHDEVTVHMLETTDWFDFSYSEFKDFRIVPWFINFLSTFPDNEGFNAIKRINFPREYSYNAFRAGKLIDERNPNVQLMLRCPKLEIMAMTFKWHTLTSCWHTTPRDLEDLLNHFQLRPMLEHKHVKQVHLEGVYVCEGEGGVTLLCLEHFAKWIVKGFREKQGGRWKCVCIGGGITTKVEGWGRRL
jgi:hypothetical protein